jgi:hypothetical protein
MEIIVYNSEKFQRWKLRYVLFTTIITAVVVLSILNNNTIWVIVLFMLLWAYFYYWVNNSQLIKIKTGKDWILVWGRNYSREAFVWYAVEIDIKTQHIKNLVLVTKKWYSIHTISDENKNIKNFILSLNDYIPMLWEYNQSMLEKMTRKFKL